MKLPGTIILYKAIDSEPRFFSNLKDEDYTQSRKYENSPTLTIQS